VLTTAGADPDLTDDAGQRPADQARERPAAILVDPELLDLYIGLYALGPEFTLKVWREQDRLFIREFAPDELYPIDHDVFFCRQEPWRVTFLRSDQGEITGIEVQYLRRTVQGEKMTLPLYVGSFRCKECHHGSVHGNQYVEWLRSRHALAYWRLATDWAEFLAHQRQQYHDITAPLQEQRCLMCHTTGAQDPDALFAQTFAQDEGVGCEACHGPGSAYIDSEVMADRDSFLAHGGSVPDEQTCRRCHRNDRFEFAEWWPQIAHPRPD
jgi:hypothetical protein